MLVCKDWQHSIATSNLMASAFITQAELPHDPLYSHLVLQGFKFQIKFLTRMLKITSKSNLELLIYQTDAENDLQPLSLFGAKPLNKNVINNIRYVFQGNYQSSNRVKGNNNSIHIQALCVQTLNNSLQYNEKPHSVIIGNRNILTLTAIKNVKEYVECKNSSFGVIRGITLVGTHSDSKILESSNISSSSVFSHTGKRQGSGIFSSILPPSYSFVLFCSMREIQINEPIIQMFEKATTKTIFLDKVRFKTRPLHNIYLEGGAVNIINNVSTDWYEFIRSDPRYKERVKTNAYSLLDKEGRKFGVFPLLIGFNVKHGCVRLGNPIGFKYLMLKLIHSQEGQFFHPLLDINLTIQGGYTKDMKIPENISNRSSQLFP